MLSKAFQGKASGRYVSKQVLADITIAIPPGEIVALFGPSGSGKSTLLRLLAGALRPDQKTVDSRPTIVVRPDSAPDCAFMPQDTRFVAARSLWHNVEIGARAAGARGRELHRRCAEAIAMVELDGYERESPAVFSGGMRQRLGLARVLAAQPSVLLLDEPLSSLDLVLRRSIASRLRDYARRCDASVLLSTHTIEESVDVADRVILLDGSPARFSRSFGLTALSSGAGTQSLKHDVCDTRADLLARVYESLSASNESERR